MSFQDEEESREEAAIIKRVADDFGDRISLTRVHNGKPIPLYAEDADVLREFWARILQTDVEPGLVGACRTHIAIFPKVEDLPWETVYCQCGNPGCILIQIGPLSEGASATLFGADEDECPAGLAVGNMQFAPEINIKVDVPTIGIYTLAAAVGAFSLGRMLALPTDKRDWLALAGVAVSAYFVGRNLQATKK